VGVAVSGKVLNQKEADATIGKHFLSLTAENAMKFGVIHPQESRWNWQEADLIADYARRRGMVMRGHTIVWHNQTPPWLFQEAGGKVSKSELFKRLEKHIAQMTSRYNDIVYAWDVLNEVIDTEKGGSQGFRLSDWYQIGGSELYAFAFKTMHDASPRARLFYNDYNNETGEKLEATLRFLSSLLDAGVPVHGVGIQGHWYYNYPNAEIIQKAIEKYTALGLEIEFTEVDISAYAFDDNRDSSQYFPAMPEDRLLAQADRYKDLFRIAAQYPSVKNITTWGVADNHTWLDNFPVQGRKNWPLLFDEQYYHKQVVDALVETGLSLGG
jgi:endo-1,4-beta-xylanase